jgi:NitT/TauT family transport system substrate-binding protein
MHRREAVSALVLASLTALVPRPARAQATREKIQVALVPAESQTNLFYAIKTGLFDRAGLDVTLIPMTSGATATTAVVTGAAQVASTSMLPLFAAHLRNIPVVMVAPSVIMTVQNPFGQLQIAVDAPYKTGTDLNGKIVGSPSLGDLNTLATKAWVDKNGGDWRSLKFVEIPNVAMESAIAGHRVAAGIMLSPQLDASLAAGTTKTLAYAYGAVSSAFMGTAYLSRRDWATQHADALRRFVRILAEGAAYVNAHAAETAPLIAEFTKTDLAESTKVHRTVKGTTLDAALVQPVIDAAAKYEQIERVFPAREMCWES